MKKYLVLMFVIAIAGCQGNPYAKIESKLSKDPIDTKPVDKEAGWFCEVPSGGIVDIAEGASESIKLACRVPIGTPVVSFTDLPSWAAIDPAQPDTLVLSPQAGDGLDPKKPEVMFKKFTITIVLASTASATANTRISLNVLVHHKGRPANISDFAPTTRILEGENYVSFFTVTSPDFPNGPFAISALDLPAGVTISKTNDPKRFKLAYSPNFTVVKLGQSSDYCSDGNGNVTECNLFAWKLNVIDPRGGMTTANAEWSVVDVRQAPRVIVPDLTTTSTDTATFYVHSEDPNGEIEPEVSALDPSAGIVVTSEVAKSGPNPIQNPYVMMNVTWKDIPPANKGTTKDLEVRSCVQDSEFNMENCVTVPVSVEFQ